MAVAHAKAAEKVAVMVAAAVDVVAPKAVDPAKGVAKVAAVAVTVPAKAARWKAANHAPRAVWKDARKAVLKAAAMVAGAKAAAKRVVSPALKVAAKANPAATVEANNGVKVAVAMDAARTAATPHRWTVQRQPN